MLAGVLGAVVTLLIITLAIAAVTIRMCFNRKQQQDNNNNNSQSQHQTDDLHRNGSTVALYIKVLVHLTNTTT